jgi:type III secretion protein S
MHGALFDQFTTTLNIVLYMSLPPLVGAMVVGLTVGILQAVTQVQDQSLPVVFKLLTVIAVIAFAGPVLVMPLIQQSVQLFDSFPMLTR